MQRREVKSESRESTLCGLESKVFVELTSRVLSFLLSIAAFDSYPKIHDQLPKPKYFYINLLRKTTHPTLLSSRTRGSSGDDGGKSSGGGVLLLWSHSREELQKWEERSKEGVSASG